MSKPANIPDAELLINSGCAHCPIVLAALAELVKAGKIGRLEVINVGIHPEQAQQRNARSTPWLRLGPFVLIGAYRKPELEVWAERAASDSGMADYFAELIENQQLPQALELVRRDPAQLDTLIALLGDLQTPMGVRIGIGALFEDLAESDELSAALPGLAKLSGAPESQVRADAAYYIGLIDNPQARELLQPLLQDDNAEVREIAAEALAH